MNLAHVGATTGLDDIFPGLGLAFSWKMQHAVTPSLLWCYRLFYSKIPEVVSVLFSKKKVSLVCTEGRNTQKKLSLRKTCGRFPECFLGGGGQRKHNEMS